MSATTLPIANRGETAVRIARAAADRGLPTVAVYSETAAREPGTDVARGGRRATTTTGS